MNYDMEDFVTWALIAWCVVGAVSCAIISTLMIFGVIE